MFMLYNIKNNFIFTCIIHFFYLSLHCKIKRTHSSVGLERDTHNVKVGGSSPPGPTTHLTDGGCDEEGLDPGARRNRRLCRLAQVLRGDRTPRRVVRGHGHLRVRTAG